MVAARRRELEEVLSKAGIKPLPGAGVSFLLFLSQICFFPSDLDLFFLLRFSFSPLFLSRGKQKTLNKMITDDAQPVLPAVRSRVAEAVSWSFFFAFKVVEHKNKKLTHFPSTIFDLSLKKKTGARSLSTSTSLPSDWRRLRRRRRRNEKGCSFSSAEKRKEREITHLPFPLRYEKQTIALPFPSRVLSLPLSS